MMEQLHRLYLEPAKTLSLPLQSEKPSENNKMKPEKRKEEGKFACQRQQQQAHLVAP